MDIVKAKVFPTNYSSDATSILKTMSLTRGKDLKVVGSMGLRSQQYAGDYDGYEKVVLHESSKEAACKELAKRLQKAVKTLLKMPKTYVGDIKCGCIDAWRVLPRDVTPKSYDAKAAHLKLKELLQKKVISKAEADSALELLKPSLNVEELMIAKSKLKFHIVRWNPKTLRSGKQTLRDGRTFTLAEGFGSPMLAKMDVIGFVQNNKYTDFSVMYECWNDSNALNPDKMDLEEALKESVAYYFHENNPFKALKRLFSLAKVRKDIKVLKELNPLLNSDLGRLYSVLGDVGTLETLLDEHPDASLKDIWFEVDQFKQRLSTIYTLHDFLKGESKILKLITEITKTKSRSVLERRLETLDSLLQKYLTHNTKNLLHKKGIDVRSMAKKEATHKK